MAENRGEELDAEIVERCGAGVRTEGAEELAQRVPGGSPLRNFVNPQTLCPEVIGAERNTDGHDGENPNRVHVKCTEPTHPFRERCRGRRASGRWRDRWRARLQSRGSLQSSRLSSRIAWVACHASEPG